MKKSIILVLFLALVILILAAILLFVPAPGARDGASDEMPNASSSTATASNIIPGPIKTSGEIVCLPHEDGALKTQECAIGLRGNDDEYYALLGLNQEDIVSGKWTTGTRVMVSGRFAIAPDSRYEIIGSIIVQQIALDPDDAQ